MPVRARWRNSRTIWARPVPSSRPRKNRWSMRWCRRAMPRRTATTTRAIRSGGGPWHARRQPDYPFGQGPNVAQALPGVMPVCNGTMPARALAAGCLYSY
ncbi:hypothetical protein CNECB9_380002 [Cupriavidus necator]|uniref:Uncharacterized protein n=1 Tax=Cupriavidus necator TaxID=106590 RepID=A0A1K0JQM3_CUPNE|nr:hypothetical protein CNECB9_380002 [Cupriavidus necator]